MFKKLPLKNILIVAAAMLVVPIMAFALTMTANQSDGSNVKNSDIKITSDENTQDPATSATAVITSGAEGYLDTSTSATGKVQTGQGSSADAVSSATGNPGATGSIQGDDNQYEDEEDDDEEDDD